MGTEMNMQEILDHIAVPRPSYSNTYDSIVVFIKELLYPYNIPYTIQEFALKPRLDFLIGITIALLGIILAVFIIRKKPVAAIITALLIPAVLILEFEYFVSIVSWLITKPAENIIIQFPNPAATRELIFAAHMDSKTALFDHIQRAHIYRLIPAAIVLGLITPLIYLIGRSKRFAKNRIFSGISMLIAVVLAAYWILFGLSFFGYVFVDDKSPGAVDDAASVAILVELAKEIQSGRVPMSNNAVTILLTTGEELNLLGAQAYVNEFFPSGNNGRKIPAMLINLDCVGQSGNLAYFESNGVFLRHYPADPGLVNEVGKAFKAVSGRIIDKGPSSTDDSVCFMAKGIPAITLCNTGIPGQGMGGFHSAADNMHRIDLNNMKMALDTLIHVIGNK
ncbi:MAG TPA: M20/M25/M40 family metallo-hydrolase [Desulfomonilia bacterium]